MPDSAEFACDTSVAVAALDAAHAAHDVCRDRVRSTGAALSGHAAFETFSVLTRMPGQLSVDAPLAARVLARAFPTPVWLSADQTVALLTRLAVVGITGGAVYDALVGEAARVNGRTLLTRDRRAMPTYTALGVRFELVGP